MEISLESGQPWLSNLLKVFVGSIPDSTDICTSPPASAKAAYGSQNESVAYVNLAKWFQLSGLKKYKPWNPQYQTQ
jgi:hypothetical protein